MTYDIAHYWPLLLIALVIGGFVGGATWVEGHREGPLSRWMTGWMPAAALCFIIGLLLAVSHILRGRAGLWLETALLAFVFYVAGCFVGGWLRAIGLESQAALSSGAAGSTLFFRRGPGWIDREGRLSGRERAALDDHDRVVAAIDDKAAGLDATPSSAAEATAAAAVAGLPASEPGGGAFFRPGPGWVDREGRIEGRERAALDDRERSLAAAEGARPGASGAVAPTPDRVVPTPTVATPTAEDASTAGPSTGTVAAPSAAPAAPDDHVAAAMPSSMSATQAAVDRQEALASAGAAATGPIAATTSAGGTAATPGAVEPSAATRTPSVAATTSSSGSASVPGGAPKGVPADPPASPLAATSTPDTAATTSDGSSPPTVPSSALAEAGVKPGDVAVSRSAAAASTSDEPSASGPITASAGKQAAPPAHAASKAPVDQPAPSAKGTLVSAPAAAEGASTEKVASTPPSVGGPVLASQTLASTPAAGDAGTFSGGGRSAAALSSPQGARPGKPTSDQASLFGDEVAPTGDAKPSASSAPPSAAAGLAPPASAAAPAVGTAADPSAPHPGQKPPALDTARGGMPDDLKLIKGIGPKNEAACNTLGVYHFCQIADWSPQNAAWVGHHMAFPGRIEREHWIPQAKLLALGIDTAHSAGVRSGAIKVDANADTPLSEAEAAAVHADMPALAAPVDDEGKHPGARPLGFAAPQGGTADDLKRIKGIGKQNEARLHGLGVWHFDQMAGWTADNVKWVGSYLAFPGRITREQWIVQAAELAAGRETPFSKRVAAGLVKTSVDDGSQGQGNVSKAPPRAT